MDAATVRRPAARRAALAVLLGVTVATAGAIPGGGPAVASGDAHRCRAPGGYTTVEIEPLGAGFSEAVDINDRGVVAGRSETPDGMHAFVWRRGRTIDITPPGGQFGVAAGINDLGEVLHEWFDPVAAAGRVGIWRNGRTRLVLAGQAARAINERGEAIFSGELDGELGDLLWTGEEVVAIEGDIDGFLTAQVLGDGGHVAGNVTPPRPPGGGHPSPATGFLWDDGVVTHALPPEGTAFRQAVDIDAQGRILFDANGSPAALWDRGVTVDLGTLGGGTLQAADINDRGQVVGNSTTATGELHAFLWQDGRMTDLASVPGTTSYAVKVNERGEVAGVQGDRAVVWACGRTVGLGDLAGSPVDINERGQVLSTGGDRMFVHTPTRR